MNLLPHGLRTFDESETYTSPERRLMLATIVNALADATGGDSTCPRPGERDRNRVAAYRWFRDAGPDFAIVCHLAGLDPDNVRRAALKYIATGARMPRRTDTDRRVRRRAARRPNTGPAATVIAAHAGVSPQAVRNVLYHTAPASTEMRARVHRAIRELTAQREEAA